MNKIKKTALIRKQLEESLNSLKDLKYSVPPRKGWIRAIREALGMRGKQMGKRLNISKQAIVDLEKNEANGAVTINTMRKAAEALDCLFVYAIVPKKTLEHTIRKRAEHMVKKNMSISNQTMLLENQQVSKNETVEMIESQIEEIMNTLPGWLWDDV